MVTRVDVVVVAYNSGSTLRRCVESLAGADQLDVVVVDNASPEGGVETIDDLPVSIIRLHRNGGFAYGCNRGWRAGSAPYVMFLNPDAVIEPAAVQQLADALENDSSLGIAGPRIVDERGNLDFSMRRFPRLCSTYAQALFLHRLFPLSTWSDEVVRDPRPYGEASEAEWVSGACIMIRRSLLDALGGMDEDFFMYCEDKDLCRRVHDSGSKIRLVPDAVVTHVGGLSRPRTALLPVLARSRLLYARKHGTPISSTLTHGGIILSALTHAVAGRGGLPARAGHARTLAALLRPMPERLVEVMAPEDGEAGT